MSITSSLVAGNVTPSIQPSAASMAEVIPEVP
jgi:hypothetical protein